MSATWATQMQHDCNTRNTSVTPVRNEQHECDTSASRTTRVRHEWKILILTMTRVKIYFHTLIFTTWQVKDYKERNNFILRTTIWKCLVSIQNAFKKCTTKTKIFNDKALSKHCTLKAIVAANALAYSWIVTHSNAGSFLIKTILCENTNIFFSKNY